MGPVKKDTEERPFVHELLYIKDLVFACVSVEGHLYRSKGKIATILGCKMLGLHSNIYNIANTVF